MGQAQITTLDVAKMTVEELGDLLNATVGNVCVMKIGPSCYHVGLLDVAKELRARLANKEMVLSLLRGRVDAAEKRVNELQRRLDAR